MSIGQQLVDQIVSSPDLSWLGQGLAVLYLVWLLNLYNFMDGIDGIAGIEAITVCGGGVLLGCAITDKRLTLLAG